MPFVKLCERNRPRRDNLKATLLERMKAEGVTNDKMAEAMGISRSTFYRLMNQHTDEWTVNQITLAFRAVNVRIKISTL